MSEEEKKGKQPKKGKENPKQPNIYEILERQQKQIDDLTKGVVQLAKAVGEVREGGGGGGKKKELGSLGEVLAAILGGDKKGGSIDSIAKTAEGMVKLGDALDRFRHPSRIGYGEMLLMRGGMQLMRAGARSTRYMTKAELKRLDQELKQFEEGWEEEEEGEHEHISPE